MTATGLLRRWARRGFIVYVRPHWDGKEVVWIVQVEGGPKVLTSEGKTLQEACEKLDGIVLKRSINRKDVEWLGPKKIKRR